MSFSFQSLNAQEKTKAQKEKELRMQEAIDAQKKAMAEQQKATTGGGKDYGGSASCDRKSNEGC